MKKLRKGLLLAMAVTGLLATLATPASAAVNDGFSVHTQTGTQNRCPDKSWPGGYAYFIDWGEGGLSDPAKNDDYITIRDTCSDGWGVMAFAWLNDRYLGSRYNGLGYDEFVVWDPFPNGNVAPGDKITIEVCEHKGSTGENIACDYRNHYSVDG